MSAPLLRDKADELLRRKIVTREDGLGQQLATETLSAGVGIDLPPAQEAPQRLAEETLAVSIPRHGPSRHISTNTADGGWAEAGRQR